MTSLIAAALVFVVTHFALANEPLRGAIVARLGDNGFLGLFSVIAALAITWLAMSYNGAPYVALWTAGPVLRALPLIVTPIAAVLIVASLTGPNPTAVMQARAMRGDEPARGAIRITRHPMMWAIVLWAGAHIAANGDLASLVLFGALFVLAALGMVQLDRKKAAKDPEGWRRFAAITSTMPFAAIATGRNRLALAEIGWWRFALGLAVFAVFLVLHPWLFGVSPLPA